MFFAVGQGFVPAWLCWLRRVCVGTLVLLMLLTEARCMRMTSRNGSRLMYQPGQAAPGMTFAPRLVSAEAFLAWASVAGASGGQSSAMRRGLQIRFAAHDGGDAGGVVASGVGVVGQAGGHQQRAEVRVAEAQRTVVVRILARSSRSDSRRCRPGFPAR